MPHRDFTHLASTAADGSATVLSVWVPLCAVDADNGCMMVVPRQLDRHFEKRYAYAHMRPALKNDSDANMLEVGSTCRRRARSRRSNRLDRRVAQQRDPLGHVLRRAALPPRVSVGLTT